MMGFMCALAAAIMIRGLSALLDDINEFFHKVFDKH